jgi:hypothetical protein
LPNSRRAQLGAGKALNPQGIIGDDPLGAAAAAMAEAVVSAFK